MEKPVSNPDSQWGCEETAMLKALPLLLSREFWAGSPSSK